MLSTINDGKGKEYKLMQVRNFVFNLDSFELVHIEDLFKFCNDDTIVFHEIEGDIYIVLTDNAYMYYKNSTK